MKKLTVSFLIILLCLPLAACESPVYSRAEVVLGDAIALSVTAKGKGARAAVGEMFDLAAEVFDDMNLSEKDSLLNKFNEDDSETPHEITEHIFNTLSLAKTAYEKSGGAFDVTSLPLSELWRVDTKGLHELRPDLDDLKGGAAKELPPYEKVKETLSHVGTDKLEFYENGGKYYLKKTDGKVKVDVGGIAKGYFVDLCRNIAEKHALKSCLIDLSGNIYLYGGGLKSGGFWTVGIKNPRPRLTFEEMFRDHVAAVKTAGNRSYSSGGDYQRFYYAMPYEDAVCEAQLIAVCHIINPKSGLPVGIKYDAENDRYETDFDAVCMAVVSAETSALCDAYSTAVSVMGIDAGAELLKENGFDGLIFTNPDLKYDEKSYPETDGFAPVKMGRGKMKAVGEWQFADGYEKYKTEYESV